MESSILIQNDCYLMHVTLNPIKEIVITSLIRMDINTITKFQAIHQSYLSWVDGILFFTTGYESEELTLKKINEGIFHIDSVFYAGCPEYSEHFGIGSYCCDALDMTGHDVSESLVSFIKVKNEPSSKL